MSSEGPPRKKKKSHYYKNKGDSKRGGGGGGGGPGRQHVLEPNLCGFLITCGNNYERQAVREAYNILNEYADILYPQQVRFIVYYHLGNTGLVVTCTFSEHSFDRSSRLDLGLFYLFYYISALQISISITICNVEM